MATYTKLPSGKWRAQVRRMGIRRGETFTFKRDAVKWAQSIEVQAQHIVTSGYQPVPDGYTFGDLLQEYIAEVKEGGRTKTATLAMLNRQLGDIKLKTINSIHLRDFINLRIKEGAGGVTIAADLSYLGAVLKYGKHARQMDLPTHLATDARGHLKALKISTRSNERDREPTSIELDRLFTLWNGSKQQRIPMPLLCQFALATAMRQDEICSILVSDVDVDEKTVIIRNRKDPQRKEGNHQRVPLLASAWLLVEQAISGRTDGKVFPYQTRSVSTAFTRACKKLNIINLHFHDLRHKAAGDLFRLGLDIPKVALITGHKDWKMLARYTHTKSQDVHNAIKKLAGNS